MDWLLSIYRLLLMIPTLELLRKLVALLAILFVFFMVQYFVESKQYSSNWTFLQLVVSLV